MMEEEQDQSHHVVCHEWGDIHYIHDSTHFGKLTILRNDDPDMPTMICDDVQIDI